MRLEERFAERRAGPGRGEEEDSRFHQEGGHGIEDGRCGIGAERGNRFVCHRLPRGRSPERKAGDGSHYADLRVTPKQDLDDAKEVASELGMETRFIDIAPI